MIIDDVSYRSFLREALGKWLMTKAGRKIIDPKAKIMSVANGTTSSVLGRVFFPVKQDGVKQEVAFRISSDVTPDCIPGWDLMQKIGS